MAKGSRNLSQYPRLSRSRKSVKLKMRRLRNKRNEKNIRNSGTIEGNKLPFSSENVNTPIQPQSSTCGEDSAITRNILESITQKDLDEAGCSFLPDDNSPDINLSLACNSETDSRNSNQDYIEIEKISVPSSNTETNYTSFPFPCGRRIIDIGYWFRTIINHKHHGLFNCTINDMIISNEIRKGLHSKFILECQICKCTLELDTDKPENQTMDINMAAVSGIVSTGNGYSQLQEITASLNMPTMSSNVYYNCEAKLYDAINYCMWDSIKSTGEMEAKLAVENGEVNADGIPQITVITDGAWSKRSYRINYTALSGVACIVGERTGKILFLGIRNKYCCICDRAKSLEMEPRIHKCFKNWSGPSTAMESDIIAEGFQCSMEMHGVQYINLIGDGDSNVYRKIVDLRPYGHDALVDKVECYNHLLRNYCFRLNELVRKTHSSVGKHVSKQLRDVLNSNILRLRIAVDCAAKKRSTDPESRNEKFGLLKRDLLNGPLHVFGEHSSCDTYFCTGPKESENNYVPEMRECGLLSDILSVINYRLVKNVKSLLLRKNSNVAERYNSVVAKFVGGKRVNFTKRFSYQLRCNAAALSHNVRQNYHYVLHKSLIDVSPGKYTKKFINNKERINKRRMMKGTQSRRKRLFAGPDKNYGEVEINPSESDMPDKIYEKEKKNFLTSLEKTSEEIKDLQEKTVQQSENILWRTERLKRLTASNFGDICLMRKTTNTASKVSSMLYSKFKGNYATRYGNEHEAIARKEFETLYNVQVRKCGLFIDEKEFHLAASPDGLIGNDSTIEIKCPATACQITPEEAIEKKIVSFGSINNGKFSLKRKHKFYFQVQGQLKVTGRQFCFFIFWTPKGMLIEKIPYNENFWLTNMAPKLNYFYFHCMLPELIDSRQKRSLPLRKITMEDPS